MKAYINSFESFGTKDGPGIRFVLFLQGCPLRCRYCHNVDAWNLQHPNYIYTSEEILEEVNRVKVFLTGEITISGGEPLLQADFVKEFFQLCHKNGIHTALDTSGYIFTEKVKEVLEETDLVLLDLKHIDSEKYYDLTSVNLSPTLEFLEYLSKTQKDTWIRYVLVPGYTDDVEDLKRWAEYVSKYSNVKRVDILPFHQMAIYKWEKERKNYTLREVLPPTKEAVRFAENIFLSYGLPVYTE